MMSFLHYMFFPVGQPWYTGAFWSNQLQWTLVTLPSLAVIFLRNEMHHHKTQERLKKLEKK